MSSDPAPHVPVLLRQAIESLAPGRGGLFIDGTFGAGGYTRAILRAGASRVVAFDRDLAAVEAAGQLCAQFPGRLDVLNAPFGRMEEMARAAEDVPEGPFADGVVLDLGVSSMQLDQPDRGFSFQSDGPLDMRMSQSGDHAGASAADLVNSLDEEVLANVLYVYGEEKKSRWIAKAIVKRRAVTPFRSEERRVGKECRL